MPDSQGTARQGTAREIACGNRPASGPAAGAPKFRRATRGLALLWLLGLLLPAALAHAIVIRHDRADSRYIAEAADYPQLFYLHTRRGYKVCLATLIARRWAITAGHCADDTPIAETVAANAPYAVIINGERFRIGQLVFHPDYHGGKALKGVDLALIELDRDVADVVPVTLNRLSNEHHRIVTLFGWGFTGTGTTGRRHNDGYFRRAQNQVETADTWLQLSFDDPRDPDSGALGLEGVPGLGDSGGPALVENEDGLSLLGVAVGELARPAPHRRQGTYGAIEVYERISLHLDWIESVTGIR